MAQAGILPVFQRSFVQIVSERKVRSIYDFAYGQYLAYRTYFDGLNVVQTGIASGAVIRLASGVLLDTQTQGGLVGLHIHLEALEASKEAAVGLAKLGLKNENKLWSLK